MKTKIDATRKKIKAAADYWADLAPIFNLLDKQIRNFAKGNPDDQAALKPEIRKNIAQLEARAAGR